MRILIIYALLISDLSATALAASSDRPLVKSDEIENKDLVHFHFPELIDNKEIILAVSVWSGKKVLLGKGISGKIQIISPQMVTKQEAYQAFLAALSVLGLTTVETGKIIKIVKTNLAIKEKLKVFYDRAPPVTNEVVTLLLPLKYVEAVSLQKTLSRVTASRSLLALSDSNILVVSDTGHNVRRIKRLVNGMDVKHHQPDLFSVPVEHGLASKVLATLKPLVDFSNKSKVASVQSMKLIADDRSNHIFVFGSRQRFEMIRGLVRKLDLPLEKIKRSIFVRPLDFLDAKKTAVMLSSLSSSFNVESDKKEQVKIVADEESNSLIITGGEEVFKSVNRILKKLDHKRAQVLIEVDILDLQGDSNASWAPSLLLGRGGDIKSTSVAAAWEAQAVSPFLLSASDASSSLSASQSASNIAGLYADDLTVGLLSSKKIQLPGFGAVSPPAIIKMAKSDHYTRSIASPILLTNESEEVAFSVGERVYFQSEVAGVGGVAQKQANKEDVDLTLTVKPQVSASSMITLNVNLEAATIIGMAENGVPRISKRKAKQTILVKNNQTIILSGLFRETALSGRKGVPLLEKIPLLGALFQRKVDSFRTSHLMIFLTPRVVHGAADLSALYKKKFAKMGLDSELLLDEKSIKN